MAVFPHTKKRERNNTGREKSTMCSYTPWWHDFNTILFKPTPDKIFSICKIEPNQLNIAVLPQIKKETLNIIWTHLKSVHISLYFNSQFNYFIHVLFETLYTVQLFNSKALSMEVTSGHAGRTTKHCFSHHMSQSYFQSIINFLPYQCFYQICCICKHWTLFRVNNLC